MYTRCNPVYNAFVFYGVLGNKATVNQLAVPNLVQVDRWIQRWLGQAGLMNLATHDIWTVTGLTYDAIVWNDSFADDVA